MILFISSINVCQWAVQSVAQHLKNFLHFCTGLQRESNSENLDHYLDDFFFAGKANSNDCQSLMTTFINICKKLQVPIADVKTEGPTCDMEYLGLTIKVITKLPNSEQSYKGKVKTHNYINRQNQSTTGKL